LNTLLLGDPFNHLLSSSRSELINQDLTPSPSQQLRHYSQPPSQSFIITVLGQDRPGLVYGVTEILAEHGINITSFDAKVTKMRGKTDYAQIYEVEIPEQVDIAFLKKELSERGKRLKVEIGLQHRNIFRAINEI
jgi:predicted amino acid-binding ACT domain protein